MLLRRAYLFGSSLLQRAAWCSCRSYDVFQPRFWKPFCSETLLPEAILWQEVEQFELVTSETSAIVEFLPDWKKENANDVKNNCQLIFKDLEKGWKGFLYKQEWKGERKKSVHSFNRSFRNLCRSPSMFSLMLSPTLRAEPLPLRVAIKSAAISAKKIGGWRMQGHLEWFAFSLKIPWQVQSFHGKIPR